MIHEIDDRERNLLDMYFAGAVDGVTGMKGAKAGLSFGDLVEVDDRLQMVVCVNIEIDNLGLHTLLCITDCDGYLTELEIDDFYPAIYGHVTDYLWGYNK